MLESQALLFARDHDEEPLRVRVCLRYGAAAADHVQAGNLRSVTHAR